MPIGNPNSNKVRTHDKTQSIAIDTSVAAGVIAVGDMCYWTGLGVASLNTAGTAKANTANFCGVSRDPYPLPVGPQVPAPGVQITETLAQGNPTITLDIEGDFRYKTTPGETYVPFQAVYLGADAQTITNVATSNGTSIGTVAPDQARVGGQVGAPNIAGATGQELCVHISVVTK